MPDLFVDDNYQDIIKNAEMPILAMFSASWCNPCKRMKPIFEDLAQEFMGQVIFAYADIETNPEMASHYGIRSVPSFGLFMDGMVLDITTGSMNKTDLRRHIKELT